MSKAEACRLYQAALEESRVWDNRAMETGWDDDIYDEAERMDTEVRRSYDEMVKVLSV